MGPLVVLESQQVVVAFLAHQAAEDAGLVRLLVVEERAGVSVPSATLVALVGFVALVDHGPASASADVAAAAGDPAAHSVPSGHPFGSVQTLLAH